MKCVICKQGETQPGMATVTLERDGVTLVIKKVPARVCQNCSEEYIDESVASQVLATAEKALPTGKEVEIREYLAA